MGTYAPGAPSTDFQWRETPPKLEGSVGGAIYPTICDDKPPVVGTGAVGVRCARCGALGGCKALREHHGGSMGLLERLSPHLPDMRRYWRALSREQSGG